ncbi:hypothetical protein D3C78_1990740 [compost metagenome]
MFEEGVSVKSAATTGVHAVGILLFAVTEVISALLAVTLLSIEVISCVSIPPSTVVVNV